MYQPMDKTAQERESLERLYKRNSTTHAFKPFLLGVSSTVAVAGLCYFTYANLDKINNFTSSIQNTISHVVVYPTTNSVQAPNNNPIIGSTNKSTITGIVDSTTLSSSYYWTMIMQGHSEFPQQAEFELAVPAGSAITRVTLWINGKAQEAAFNSTERVTLAYEAIRTRSWDPLLVTWISPERVLVKAFPVSARDNMKIRLGMTSPVSANEKGEMSLKMPYIVKSNLNFDCQQDVHLESDASFTSNRNDITSELSVKGKYANLVRGNIPYERLSDVTMTGQRKFPLKQFAVQAKHASPGNYILATQETGIFGQPRLKLEKTNTRPRVYIVNSEEAAHRISNLWAIDQIQKAVERGERSSAMQLAMAYRVVSPVSGATVLSSDADYQRFGLHRDFGRIYGGSDKRESEPVTKASHRAAPSREVSRFSGFVPPPPAIPLSMPASAGAAGAPDIDTFSDSQAPMLQGTTNGTIGPQGGDATTIIGVNTAGTVSVDNSLNWYGYTGNQLGVIILSFIAGILLFAKGVFQALKKRPYKESLGLGLTWVLLGYLNPGLSLGLLILIPAILIVRGLLRRSTTR